MYYSEAIKRIDDKLRAVVQYNTDGTLDQIVWDDDAYKTVHGADQVHPSMADIEVMCATVKAEKDALAYQRKRELEYPSIEDVTVAIAEYMSGDERMWKKIKEQRNFVKQKYPKG